ncbi:MAG TPA: hypothetical protein VGJ22_07580 [Anaerolineales bacterium]|jgi:uncharacterized protein YraI
MKHRQRTLLFLSGILILACSCPLVSTTGVPATSTVPVGVGSPTNTFVPLSTSAVAVASPNGQAVNCRTGPGTSWPIVITLNPGQSAEIVGRNAEGTWWQVKNPAVAGSFCWMSATFVTVSGDVSGVAIAAGPPAPAASATAVAGSGIVTNVSVSVDPEEIHVGGCVGPLQQSTVTANIVVNGAVKIDYHFETEQDGVFPIHGLNFNKASDKDVSQEFSPSLSPGNYWVKIVIEGVNLSGMHSVATYDVTC